MYSILNGVFILSEVTNSLLAEPSGGLHGMRSAGAIKTKVWRARQKLNPMPKIPRNHQDIMEIPQLPDKLTKTKDGQSFLLAQCWTNDDQEKSLMVFLSDYGADILRNAKLLNWTKRQSCNLNLTRQSCKHI